METEEESLLQGQFQYSRRKLQWWLFLCVRVYKINLYESIMICNKCNEQKQSFADALQNRCSWQFCKFHSKAPMFEPKETPIQVFSCEICVILLRTLFYTQNLRWFLIYWMLMLLWVMGAGFEKTYVVSGKWHVSRVIPRLFGWDGYMKF